MGEVDAEHRHEGLIWGLVGMAIVLAYVFSNSPAPAPQPERFDTKAEEFIGDLMRGMLGPQTPQETVVWNVDWAIIEINNGGFHQFFYNSTGDNAQETAEMMRKIGAPQCAALIDQGCALFPDGKPAHDLDERRAQLAKFSPADLAKLEELQERFYDRDEDLHLLLKQYWNHETRDATPTDPPASSKPADKQPAGR